MPFQLKSLGSNGKFQLGLGNDEDQDVWQNVLEFCEEPKVVCGGNHTLLIVGDEVLVCGDNSKGQCGIEGVEMIHEFTRVPRRWVKTKFISAGWEFTVFVTESNEIWSCGAGYDGELGSGEKTSGLQLVTKFDIDVILIQSSLHHTILKLSNGDVFGWGNNKKEQICSHDLDKSNRIIWAPLKIDINDVGNFVLGRDFTLYKLEHKFEFRGRDRFNILKGLSEYVNLSSRSIDMKSMWSSVHFLQNGSIYSFGNNSHGQMFPYSLNKISEGEILTGIGEIVQFATGSEHGLLVCQGKVFSWGWGEHGNCGRHISGVSRKESVVFDYLNEIYSSPVHAIYCGYSTSWIVIKI